MPMPVPIRAAFHNKAEAKYNVTTEFPSLGLHSAASTGNVGLVEYALNNGQPVNSVLDGVLPLHAACAGGNVQVVKVLIDHGADVNAPRLPRKYSLDKGRDSSAPIVGTSGSTPLHFAAANGNTEVVSLLLLHGAHADRPDKHGVTPEMLASQNGWVESAGVLKNWILNKDRDLRERAPAPTNGFPGHDPLEAQASSSSPRRRLHVKQSIDTALNILKPPDYLTSKTAQSMHSSTPPASPHKPFGEYTFYPVDTSNPSPIDPGSRRPSLPHILQPPANESSQRPCKRPRGSSTDQRRPSSAGTGADRKQEPEIMYPVYGRGGSGRKLGSKYSLLNIFKKAQSGDGSENVETSDSSSVPHGSTVTLPLPSTPNRSAAQVSNTELADPSGTLVVANNRAGIQHRGSDASTRSRILPSSLPQQSNIPPLPSKPSDNVQTPPRVNTPLAVELHLALAQQQQQRRNANSNASQQSDIPGDGGERVKPSSPLAKLNAILLPSHSRHRSSSMPPTPDSSAIDKDDDASVNGIPESESGKPSPSPRPGILRAHNRNPSSSGQTGSPLSSRVLRFDSTSSNPGGERKARDSPRSTPGTLRSYNSASSLSKMHAQADVENEKQRERVGDTPLLISHPVEGEVDGDEEEYYGKSIGSPEGFDPSIPSVLLQRQRGMSFTSSSESSLSPILTNEVGNDPTMTVLKTEFPFSIDRPPSLLEPAEDIMSSPTHLTVPITSDTRNRGDSLSSTSTSDSHGSNLLMRSSGTSGSDTSMTVSSPGMPILSAVGKDLSKSPEQVRARRLTPLELEESNAPPSPPNNHLGFNRRRSRTPLDIDITSISSHAQAEALVQRARQEVLDIASTNEGSPPGSGAGPTPLSARLAAYGESLELERKLREQKEEQSSRKDRGHNLVPPALNLGPTDTATTMQSPISTISPDQSRNLTKDGIERQLSLENKTGAIRSKRRLKDPRRPSTADGVSSNNKQDMFSPDRSYSHHSSRSASTNNYSPAPTTDDPSNQYQKPKNYQTYSRNDRAESPASPDYGQPPNIRSHTPILPSDENLSRINSSDGADTETDSANVHRTSTAPVSVRGKREQARTAKKLTKMGYPVADQAAAASRAAPPPAPAGASKRLQDGFKSFMQTFKGKA